MPIDASADRREPQLAPSAARRDKAPETAARPTEFNSHVGALLRTMHGSVLNEPVPDRFLDLLRRIEEKGEAAPAASETLAKPG
jgi:hypothetical protein